MTFFDDLKFVHSGFVHDCDAAARDKLFDGYYGIQFILRGEIFVHVEGKTPWQASGPLVFFTTPDQKYTYYSPNSGLRDHLFLCFKGARVQRYLSGGLFPSEPGVKIPITAPEELVKLFSTELITLRKNDFTSQGEAILNLERILLYILAQPKIRHKESSLRNIIKKTEDEIADRPGDAWDFSEIASKNNLSEVHFRRLFINETGISPWKYVVNCRIRYACQLLHSSTLRIKEIAGKCGYDSEFSFSRQFHKVMKISPKNFRKGLSA